MPSLGPPDVERLKANGDLAGLITALEYSRDWRARRDAAEALGAIGEGGALEALITALIDENWTVRKAAAVAIRQMRDVRSLEPFVAALQGHTEEARMVAAEALGGFGDALAVEPLIGALEDRSWDVRAAVARALGQIGDVRAVAPLIAAMRDPDLGVRDAAAGSLVRIGPAALESLMGALDDESWDVRRTAALALGQLGDERATSRLLAALGDLSDPWLRRNAALALGHIGDASAIEALRVALRDDAPSVREAASAALAAFGSRPVESATGGSSDKADNNRQTASAPTHPQRGPRSQSR